MSSDCGLRRRQLCERKIAIMIARCLRLSCAAKDPAGMLTAEPTGQVMVSSRQCLGRRIFGCQVVAPSAGGNTTALGQDLAQPRVVPRQGNDLILQCCLGAFSSCLAVSLRTPSTACEDGLPANQQGSCAQRICSLRCTCLPESYCKKPCSLRSIEIGFGRQRGRGWSHAYG